MRDRLKNAHVQRGDKATRKITAHFDQRGREKMSERTRLSALLNLYSSLLAGEPTPAVLDLHR